MRIITKGATSQSLYFVVLDSSSTTGGRLTTLAWNTASLTAYYVRNGSTATAITLATLASAGAAWSSGGFIAVDATNMPGVYRLDVPDAALATGVDAVVITLKGATNMAQVDIEIQLVAANLQDTVRLGLTALPNVASGNAGALVTSGTGTAQLSTASGLVTLAGVTHTGAVIPTVSAVTGLTASNLDAAISTRSSHSAADVWAVATRALTDKADFALSAASRAAVVDETWDEARAGHVAAGSFGEGAASVQGNVTGSVASVTGNVGGNVAGSVGSVTGAVGSVTGNVGGNVAGSVASVTGNVGGNVVGSVGSVVAEVTPTAASKTGYRLSATGVDDILDEALTELAAVPAAAPSLRAAMQFLFQALRNRTTTTASAQTIQNDAGATIATAALSDDGTTFTKGEFA